MSASAGHESQSAVDKAIASASDGATPGQMERVTNRPRLKKTDTMNGPLYMQTSKSNVVLVRRLKRKDQGTWKHLARWFVENQIGTATYFLGFPFLPCQPMVVGCMTFLNNTPLLVMAETCTTAKHTG